MTIAADSMLTDVSGLKKPSAIRRWLDKQRIPYITSATGWPKVLEASIIERMSGKPTPAHEPRLRLKNGA